MMNIRKLLTALVREVADEADRNELAWVIPLMVVESDLSVLVRTIPRRQLEPSVDRIFAQRRVGAECDEDVEGLHLACQRVVHRAEQQAHGGRPGQVGGDEQDSFAP